MIYEMKLQPAFYNYMLNGTKRIEIRFNDFREMIDNLKIEELADEILTKDELLSTLEKYYTKEQQEKYGTLGIRIKLIAN